MELDVYFSDSQRDGAVFGLRLFAANSAWMVDEFAAWLTVTAHSEHREYAGYLRLGGPRPDSVTSPFRKSDSQKAPSVRG